MKIKSRFAAVNKEWNVFLLNVADFYVQTESDEYNYSANLEANELLFC